MILSFDRPPAPLGWRQALDPLGKKRSREELSGRLARKDTFEVERQEEEGDEEQEEKRMVED